ncbi:hypothetical protein CTAYLR_000534 [Chrysophaeum taylorii]|uniref:Sugar phosphate phosphatase n=1 Tax=Chrysophaeum taylorii TaxID=2483200 RepID=A0AAD7UJA2_9STRA|nr:hypothetical protein CTAYLR_000534 [Chrysophaeum taylorii]
MVVLPMFRPMPEPLRSTEVGTWAHDTMSRRVIEEIVDRVVYGDNDVRAWEPALEELRRDVVEGGVLRALDEEACDAAAWNNILGRHEGETWLSAPWLVAEFYLYRRIAGLSYFKDGRDCFETAKAKGLAASLPTLKQLKMPPITELFVAVSLWGNRMDLSLWPEGGEAQREFDEVLARGKAQLLADDSEELLAHLRKGGEVADLIVDNAGFEVLTDLLLADHLVSSGAVQRVRFRVKHHPTFVSDVMAKDLDTHVEALRDDLELKPLGDKWKRMFDDGTFVVANDDGYWAMPFAFWEMPEALRADLATSHLLVIKGDANYRRCLGDRPWPLDAPFSQVCSYFPAPVVCLRTLKAELGCGMDPVKLKHAQTTDPNFFTNGKWGVIQFATPYDN